MATYETGTAHVEPVGYAGAQFVVVDVSVPYAADAWPVEMPFTPVVDGTELPDRAALVVGPPKRGDPSRRIAVEVPIGEYESVAVRTSVEERTVTWNAPDRVVRKLGVAPRFDITEFSAPDRVAHGESFAVEFAVENGGERDGVFLYEVGVRPDVPETEMSVDAGETVTTQSFVSPVYEEGTSELFVYVRWGLGGASKTVDVRPE